MLTDAPRRARSMCPASELGGTNGSNPSPKTLAPALTSTLTLTLPGGGVAPRILGWSKRLQRLLMRHAAAVSASTLTLTLTP